jgi:micrococcal nuclease
VLFLVLCAYGVYVLYHLGDRYPEKLLVPSAAKTYEIIDGDTFKDANGETVRLLGIDTPERGQPFYLAATGMLDSLLNSGNLRYEFDFRRRGPHGRLLAYVFVNDRFVNAELVRAGMASVYIYSDHAMKNMAYRQQLIDYQKQARENHLGIWSLEPPEEEEFYCGNRNSLVFHRPDCRSAKKLKEGNRIIKSSRDEFLDLGYSPCRNCKP